MITISAWLVFVPLGTFLAGVGCGLLLTRPGRAADHALDDAYEEGRADEKRAWLAEPPAPGEPQDAAEREHEPERLEPLVPEPARLPDSDTLTRMYAELGDQEDGAAGCSLCGHCGPDCKCAHHGPRQTAAQRRRDKHKRRGPYADPADTDWDLSPGAERVQTIAEHAEHAEFRVWETELDGQIASAWQWFDETFATGTFRAVR